MEIIEIIEKIEDEMVCANACSMFNKAPYILDKCTCYKRRSIQTVENLLETLKRAYRKHQMNDNSIGWEELASEMCNTLCEAMGDKTFQEFAELTRPDQIENMNKQEYENFTSNEETK